MPASIGEATMAVFGLPLSYDDNGDRAVCTGVAMLRALVGFNRQRAETGLPPIPIPIRLHTDVIVCGNTGSHRHMNATVIGDAPKLPSRLESA
jgi:class 3 adenylate cyclase